VIFLDTSAIYALADRSDANHSAALDRFEVLLEADETLLTHNYVLLESMALLQHRLGTAAAIKLARSASGFEILWVDRKLHEAALRRLTRSPRRKVSLVDHVSFLVMKSRGLEAAFAFDPDFEREGFRLLAGS
jgi:predicted nucleic acid-binding protein